MDHRESGAAVLLRVVATFFVAQLLRVRYLKLAGGLLHRPEVRVRSKMPATPFVAVTAV